MPKIEIPAWIKEMPDDKLKEDAESLYDSIYKVDCFSAKDPLILDLMLGELEKRGFHICEDASIFIDREDDDD